MPRQTHSHFLTEAGTPVPAVTSQKMREVDQVAVEEFGLGILQMMENAGRTLARTATEMVGGRPRTVTVLAGGGGNGGGGLCCARHLLNHGFAVRVVLDREAAALRGPARIQYEILANAGVGAVPDGAVADHLARSALVIDALIGYSLRGAPRGRAAALIEMGNRSGRPILSLDVPSGLDATSGAAPGAVIRPDSTLTLALPKSGLKWMSGDLYLADIGIPHRAFERTGIAYSSPFGDAYRVKLIAADGLARDAAKPPRGREGA